MEIEIQRYGKVALLHILGQMTGAELKELVLALPDSDINLTNILLMPDSTALSGAGFSELSALKESCESKGIAAHVIALDGRGDFKDPTAALEHIGGADAARAIQIRQKRKDLQSLQKTLGELTQEVEAQLQSQTLDAIKARFEVLKKRRVALVLDIESLKKNRVPKSLGETKEGVERLKKLKVQTLAKLKSLGVF